MTIRVEPPISSFFDIDGQPLESGNLYIGSVGLNPESNPITVYFDEALTSPAPQPIRTIGGFPVNGGLSTRLYTSETDYSIAVRNKNGSLVRSSLSGNSDLNYSGQFTSINFDTVADMIAASFLTVGSRCSTKGYYTPGDGGHADYLIIANQTADGYGDHILTNDNVAKLMITSSKSVKCFGAKADGSFDDTPHIAAAIAYAKSEYFEIVLERGSKISSLTVDQFDDCVIRGGSLITDVATTFPVGTLHITNSSRVKLVDIEIDGKNQGESGAERTLLSCDSSNSLLVQRCRFTTPGGYSISPQRSSKFKLLDCALNGASLWAVGCPSLIVSGNHISNTLFDSVKLTAYAPEPIGTPATDFCDMAVIANNIFDGSAADFIDIYAAGRNVVITGNTMDGASVHGVQIKNVYRDPADYTDGGSSDYLGQGYDITVANNIIKNVTSHGVHVVTDDFRAGGGLTDGEKIRDVNIIGNDISDCNRGVYFRDIVDISVKSNIVYDCSNRAIMSGNCKRAVVADNSVRGSAGFSDGIYLTGDSSADVSDVTITGNKVTGYTTGIYVRGYNGSVSSNNVDGAGTSGIITQFTLGLTCIGNSVGTPDGGAGAAGSVGISVRDPSASVFSGNSVRDNDTGYSFTATSSGASDGGIITSNTYVTCTTPVSDNITDKTNMQIGLNAFAL